MLLDGHPTFYEDICDVESVYVYIECTTYTFKKYMLYYLDFSWLFFQGLCFKKLMEMINVLQVEGTN